MASEIFDLAVIGAGIVGVSAAYLAGKMEPSWSVLLVDRSFVGSGATYYSGGHNHPYGKTAGHKRLALQSAEVFDGLKSEIPELPLYELSLFGIVRKSQAAEVIDGFIKDGVRPATREEERQLRLTFPDLAISEEQVLLTGCTGGYGLPREVAMKIADHFRRRLPSQCWEGVEVKSITQESETFLLLTADGRSILARRVLVATGPWALEGPGAEVFRAAGVRIKKVVSLHVDRIAKPTDPILYFFDEECYLLPITANRQWIFSFTSQEWDVRPGPNLRINSEDRAIALATLNRYCPAFVESCNGGRVFCDAYSHDYEPVVTQMAADLVVAGACSGYGFRLAPGIALDALRLFSGVH